MSDQNQELTTEKALLSLKDFNQMAKERNWDEGIQLRALKEALDGSYHLDLMVNDEDLDFYDLSYQINITDQGKTHSYQRDILASGLTVNDAIENDMIMFADKLGYDIDKVDEITTESIDVQPISLQTRMPGRMAEAIQALEANPDLKLYAATVSASITDDNGWRDIVDMLIIMTASEDKESAEKEAIEFIDDYIDGNSEEAAEAAHFKVEGVEEVNRNNISVQELGYMRLMSDESVVVH